MDTTIYIPFPEEQYREIVDFLRSNGDPRDPVEIVSTAVEYWIDNASWKPELLAKSDARGYQWKSLFLPAGTQIRMQYKGTYSYAKVSGDEIIYHENAISPSNLANSIAGSNRNAWRDLWIKRPLDKEWKLANDCRMESEELAAKFLQEIGGKLHDKNQVDDLVIRTASTIMRGLP